jgi:hypothetical protein
MRNQLIAGLAAGALGLVVACSSSSSQSTPPDSDTAAFCTDWAKAVCQLSSICNFDPATCSAYQTGVCNDFVQQAQSSSARHYTQPGGKACIDALNSAYGGSPSRIDVGKLTSLEDTCNKAFTGNVASDSACTSDYDCQSGLRCSTIPGQNASVCASGNPKNAGDICSAGDTCATNTYCAPVTGAEPKCKPAATMGQPCSAQIPCDSMSYCGPSGTCQMKAAMGEACATNADCSTGYCDVYPPAACTDGLTFARGAIDCNGVAGLDRPDSGGPTVTDSGTGNDGGTTEAATGDAPSGG